MLTIENLKYKKGRKYNSESYHPEITTINTLMSSTYLSILKKKSPIVGHLRYFEVLLNNFLLCPAKEFLLHVL